MILRTLEAGSNDGEDLIDRKAANETRLEELETDIRRLEGQWDGLKG